MEIAYHNAKAGLWERYDADYRHVLMRGQEDYACDSLGMWSEMLDLTALVFGGEAPGYAAVKTPALLDKPYYLSRYARSLKHLGYGEDASQAYHHTLLACAGARYRHTTIYLNNALTLQIYRGRIKLASRMAPWNIATMDWLPDDDGVRNQKEHGGYSIGWLAMLLGDFKTAKALFKYSEDAWVGREHRRRVHFQYYPIYFVELALLSDDRNRAEALVEDQLRPAQEHRWRETEARCMIAESMIGRHAARRRADPIAKLASALNFCDQAEKALDEIFAPPVEIELMSERLCIFYEAPDALETDFEPRALLTQLNKRIARMGWELYRPESHAFHGLYAFHAGDEAQARQHLKTAEDCARAQGNRFWLTAPLRPISLLRSRLNPEARVTRPRSRKGPWPDLAASDFAPMNAQAFTRAISDGYITEPELRSA